jgi:hypothetical protein
VNEALLTNDALPAMVTVLDLLLDRHKKSRPAAFAAR